MWHVSSYLVRLLARPCETDPFCFAQRVSSQGPRTTPTTPGNIDGEWAHDLHSTVNGAGASSSLASRLSAPRGPASQRLITQRAGRIASALDAIESQPEPLRQVNVRPAVPTGPRSQGLSIRGLAGPFAVMAQNFAPGTTAADIESAMTPVGGEMLSCVIVKTSPFLIAEMVFASKEGADIVINTFNNQTVSQTTLPRNTTVNNALDSCLWPLAGWW